MKYTIYKGIEAPATIRDFLLEDWNKVIGLTGGAGVVIALALNAWLSGDSDMNGFLTTAGGTAAVYLVLVRLLHSRTRRKKYAGQGRVMTVSNLEVCKRLKKRKRK